MVSPQQIRILSTIVSFVLLKFTNAPISLVLVAVVLLDFLDCSKYIYPDNKCLKKYKNEEEFKEYQQKDKLIDLMTYFFVLVIFYPLFDTKTLYIFVVLLLWRTIGVYKFVKTRDTRYLKIFFDGINALLFLAVLSAHYVAIRNNYDLLLIPFMLSKIVFDSVHHS